MSYVLEVVFSFLHEQSHINLIQIQQADKKAEAVSQ